MDPSDGHELALAARVARSEDIPPQTSVWRFYAGTCMPSPEKSQVYLGCDQGSKSMEVAGVGNAVDAKICGFSRRSPPPGQPRFPEHATQQGYFLP
jgi:hypothetical protein